MASVCIPPCYVKEARDYVADRLKICTVIGFPNGYQTTAVKVAETKEAVEDGADEIDMVININRVKDDRFEEVLQEVKEIRAACEGKVLKVIIETCLLTKEEKIKMCEIVTKAGADYIKTSTGRCGTVAKTCRRFSESQGCRRNLIVRRCRAFLKAGG